MPRKLKTQDDRIRDYLCAKTYLPKWFRGWENINKVLKAFEDAYGKWSHIDRTIILTFLLFMGEHGYKLKKVTGDMQFKSMKETLKPKHTSVDDALKKIKGKS